MAKLARDNKQNYRYESTVGADASVEVPKLLLYTHYNNYHDALINFVACACRQNPESQGNSRSG